MARIELSQIVDEKLVKLSQKLIDMCGEKKGKNIISHIISGLENLQLFPNAGIPISVIYDVETEFQKYYVLFIEKNYFLYYIENDIIYIVEMYNEKEDVAGKFFGIHTTTQETLDYWKE